MATSAELFRKALQEATKAYGAASELARKAGMKPPQLYKLMATDSSPSLDTLDRIAAALDTTPAALLGGTPPPSAREEFLRAKLDGAMARVTDLELELAVLQKTIDKLQVPAIPEKLADRIAAQPEAARKEVVRAIEDALAGLEARSKGAGGDDPPPRSPSKAAKAKT